MKRGHHIPFLLPAFPSSISCLSFLVHPAFVSFVPLSSRPEASSDDRRTMGAGKGPK